MPQFQRELHPETDEFTSSYLEAAEWADKPEEEDWSSAEWAPEAVKRAKADCIRFRFRASDLLVDLDWDHPKDTYPIAYDFWLTRQGHGSGFWDGNYPEPAARNLTEIAKGFEETNIYLGDDGLIYFG